MIDFLNVNNRQFNQIIKEHLISHFDGFVTTRRGELISVPMNHVWRGFIFAPSAYSKESFYLSADVMPLFIPTDFLYRAEGGRLWDGKSQTWEWSQSEAEKIIERLLGVMKSQGMAILDEFQSPFDLTRNVRPESSNSLELVAYSLVYSEMFEESLPAFEKLLEVDRRFLRPDSPEYQIKKTQRHETLYQLVRNDPRRAKAQLEEWEKQTIVNLKLEKVPN